MVHHCLLQLDIDPYLEGKGDLVSRLRIECLRLLFDLESKLLVYP